MAALKTSSTPIVGIIVLVLSTWSLSALDANGKWIMAMGVPIWIMAWFRYLVHIILVLGLMLPIKGLGILKAKRPKDQIWRGFVMLLATMSFFTTLYFLPQAEATAIAFLSPLLVLSLAPFFLKEPAYLSRWVAAAVGFMGVLIIIRPDAGLPFIGVVFGFITALLFAIQYMITRRVAIEDPMTTLIWSGAFGTIALTLSMPVLLPPALPVLKNLSVFEWFVLLSTGFWGGLGHLLQIQAYRLAPASVLAPFIYLQIVAAAGLGWLVWGVFPDALSWLGIAIISASGVTIALIEWRRRQASKKT